METTLYIKNMVCHRCIKVVKDELTRLGYEVSKIALGEAIIKSSEKSTDLSEIRKVLVDNGFDLVDDKNSKLIEKIKVLIIEKIHHQNNNLEKFSFSKYLSNELGVNYSHLSSIFSSCEGITIEKFIIKQKIEKVKELLTYDELTLSEISFMFGYSSVQHLSNQFKQITGLNPSYFKKLKEHRRKPLDKINEP
ncbi:MAG: AraC family transcriptional regulator [Ignavibacteria bacterium RBG_16_36_9]|nr:MAG: AraC family transcriptional regulator [Ignavibacteria bacterium RBG_16_36_9]